MTQPLKITILGLSITSSWGNGHATTFRHLVRALTDRGHDVCFLEREAPWYADNRDLPDPPYGCTLIYHSLEELTSRFTERVRQSDLVIVGSYVPEGIFVGAWVTSTAEHLTAFYDVDTPVTLSKLRANECDYLTRELVPQYDMYLSFTGGPVLDEIEQRLGSPYARALYCSVDERHYCPLDVEPSFDLGYMGTYSEDRQFGLERLLIEPAQRWPEGRFVVAGPQYPPVVQWPSNVRRIEHVGPAEHPVFYNSQRFTLNVTRRDMVQAGYAPSIRLFEAAACGTPIISDHWQGLDSFFQPGEEILIADRTQDVLRYLHEIDGDSRRQIGRRARDRILQSHTASHRAVELEQYVKEVAERKQSR